jgi:Uma2 family endonuclease
LTARTRFAYPDYLALPEALERIELIDGELVREPAPGVPHQRIVGNLYVRLRRFVEKRRLGLVLLGPVDVVLGPEGEEDVFQPDVLFVAPQGMAIIGKAIRGAPELVIEVVSPDSPRRDRELKRRKYQGYGIREYWIVEPESRTIEVLARKGGEFASRGVFGERDAVSTEVLAGLTLRARDAFA